MRRIRLTESQFNRLVNTAVRQSLNEIGFFKRMSDSLFGTTYGKAEQYQKEMERKKELAQKQKDAENSTLNTLIQNSLLKADKIKQFIGSNRGANMSSLKEFLNRLGNINSTVLNALSASELRLVNRAMGWA